MKDILRSLCLQIGMSGHEEPVGKFIRSEFEKCTNDILCDNLGNLTAVFKSENPNAKNVMIFAHMDQLGLIVKNVDNDGYLKIERVGGIPEKILPGLEVVIGTQDGGYIEGVIGNRSHHITPAEEKYHVSKLAELYIDCGFYGAKEAEEAGVKVGSPVIYKPRFTNLKGDVCYGTAMDNRGGCAILIDIARRIKGKKLDTNIFLTATVLEEYNLRGAKVAASYIKPDCAIALDVAITGDTPDTKGVFPVKLGDGPVLSLYNFHGRGTLNGTMPHPKLVKMVEQFCKEDDIPLQRIATAGLLTDASYVQLCDKGVPVIDLGFPCRYTHTAVEMCDAGDLVLLSKLTEKLALSITADMDFVKSYR